MVLHIYFFRDTSNLSTTSPGVVLFVLNSSVSELILGSVGLESVKSKETVQIDYMYVCLSFYFTTVLLSNVNNANQSAHLTYKQTLRY